MTRRAPTTSPTPHAGPTNDADAAAPSEPSPEPETATDTAAFDEDVDDFLEDDADAVDEKVGWSDLGRLLGQAPDDIGELVQTRPLEQAFLPLARLVGKSPADFVIRAAALLSLQSADHHALTPEARDIALSWLPEPYRSTVLRNLSRGGWIHLTDAGWTFTRTGQDLYQLISLLFHFGKRDDLAFSNAVLRALKALNGDPYFILKSLVNQVRAIEHELETARSSQSSVKMEGAIGHCRGALSLVQTVVRETDSYQKDPRAIQDVQNLHAANARMMWSMARLEEILAEITKQHIVLPAGYTPHQITMSLMSLPLEVLAEAGARAMGAPYAARNVLREDYVCLAASNYLDKERPPQPLRPKDAAEAKHNPDFRIEPDPRVERLFHDLAAVAGDEVAVADLLNGQPEEILFRLAALGLLGFPSDPDDPEKARLSKTGWTYVHQDGVLEFKEGPVRVAPKSRLRRKIP